MKKKRLVLIILIITMIFTMTSCSKIKNDNATIQLWWYNYKKGGGDAVENVISRLKHYCDKNNIPIEIIQYSEDTLAYEDYILKRNAAMASGNMITIDDARSLTDIAKHHADYSKVENYKNLFDVYKDKFCIPIGIRYTARPISNKVLEYYNINTDRSIITYNDYLDIKQQIKEQGGRFKLNKLEHRQLLDYYLIKNGLKFINEDSSIINNTDEFKKAIKKASIEMYDDLKLYYKDYDNIEFLYTDWTENDNIIYDQDSGEKLLNYEEVNESVTSYGKYYRQYDSILDTTYVITYEIFKSPCVYMYKKITNQKIYDVLNQLLDESYYITANGGKWHYYFPVHNTEKIRELLEVDKNWQYIGNMKEIADNGDEKHKKHVDIINESYELLVYDREASQLIASYYFHSWEISANVYWCVYRLVEKLIIDKLDYNSSEGDKFINEYVDEFVKNFNVHYN